MLYKASPFKLNFKFFSCVMEIISYNPAVLMTAIEFDVQLLVSLVNLVKRKICSANAERWPRAL